MNDRLRRLASRQWGLFTRAQAKQSEFSDDQIRRRVAQGTWRVVIGAVLAPEGLDLTPKVRDRAAQLAVPGSVLAGPSAARAFSIPIDDDRVCLAVAPDRHPRHAGIVYLRARVDSRDLGWVGRARVTWRERTIVDCLGMLAFKPAMDLLDHALLKRWITLDDFDRRVQERTGGKGNRQLRTLLTLARPGGRSYIERVAIGHLRAAGIEGWVANAPIYHKGRVIAIGDLVFEDCRLVVEIDGWAFHSMGGRFGRDRERQNDLVLAEWHPLRFTYDQIMYEPEKVMRTIRATLRNLRGRV